LILATSEAGLLPLYSRWESIDTWGLNDVHIAHAGGMVDLTYLAERRPAVIAFHAFFSPAAPPARSANEWDAAWTRQTLTLRQFAEQERYVLAAAYCRQPQDCHLYYVDSATPRSRELVHAVRVDKYAWVEDGGLVPNIVSSPDL